MWAELEPDVFLLRFRFPQGPRCMVFGQQLSIAQDSHCLVLNTYLFSDDKCRLAFLYVWSWATL